MRPPSHREQVHDKCCGNCRHSAVPEYKDDLLCFCGDNVVLRPSGLDGEWRTDVELAGDIIGLMDGDEYGEVWGDRVVDADDVCDEWKPETGRDGE